MDFRTPSPRDRSANPLNPRVEERGVLWRVAAEEFGARRALRAWAVAQLLFTRGEMAPQPLAMLRRDKQMLLWFERNTESQRLDKVTDAAHRLSADRAARALVGRLAALGRFEREIQPHGISVQLREGRWHVPLLDVTAFGPGRPV